MSDKYNDYLKTDYWKAVSDAVKKRAGYRCQICNSQHDLNAHHRTYEHRGKEMDHLDDLTCLCRRCHEVFHGKAPLPAVPQTLPATVAIIGHSMSKRERRMKRRMEKNEFEARFPKQRGGYLISPIIESEIAALLPTEDPIILTPDLINRCRRNGAFTSATLRALGVPMPLITGWPERMVGAIISRQMYREALEGRNVYATLKGMGRLVAPLRK